MAIALTEDERAFLVHMGIPEELVFDAAGMRKAAYLDQMREGGYEVAYRAGRPCAVGHRMRWRHGHCAQCNPDNFSYQNRKSKPGIVYVAESEQACLVKVGTSSDIATRIKTLRTERYGGASDWRVRWQAHCVEGGKVEKLAHQLLKAYGYAADGCFYLKEGRAVECGELYRCSGEYAQTVLFAAWKLHNAPE